MVTIDILSLYVFPRNSNDGHHREKHEQDLEDAPYRELDLSNSFFVGSRKLISLSIDPLISFQVALRP